MHADWTVECGADDPVLVVPWTSADDPEASVASSFVDLRENPYDLDQVVEAEQHPPLMQALRALNATRSPVFTAKCDAWPMQEEELEATHYDLNVSDVEVPFGFASYIDLLWRERTIFVSFHQAEQRLMRLARLADALDHPYAAVECVLRPAMVDVADAGGRAQEGFCTSLYVKAVGTDAPHAYEHWSAALQSVVTLLRGKDFAGA